MRYGKVENARGVERGLTALVKTLTAIKANIALKSINRF
jgi:hypothetical protein